MGEMRGEKRGERKGERRGERRGEKSGEKRGEMRGEMRGDVTTGERGNPIRLSWQLAFTEGSGVSQLAITVFQSTFPIHLCEKEALDPICFVTTNLDPFFSGSRT